MPLKRYTGNPEDFGTEKEMKEMEGNKNSKRWTVTYGGFKIYEGDDEEKAYDAYIGCGPYGRIWESEE